VSGEQDGVKVKIRSAFLVLLLLACTLISTFSVISAQAANAFYIRADGTIDPPTAAISRDGYVYALTDNLDATLVVEMDDIVIDGAGHALQEASDIGISIDGRNNVTIKNMRVVGLSNGIAVGSSSNIRIHRNVLSYSGVGIRVSQSQNIAIFENNVTMSYAGAIDLYRCSNSSIWRNNIRSYKLWGDGISLRYSSNNTLSANNVSSSEVGIALYLSNLNDLYSNFIVENKVGILFESNIWPAYDASGNKLRNNALIENDYNIWINGVELQDFVQYIDTSNTVDGKPIYYLINQRHFAVPPDAGYVAIINSTDITVKGLNLSKNGQGVLLAYTTDCQITGNNITKNGFGVQLLRSSAITIFNNSATWNFFGIYVFRSSQNIMSMNNITASGEAGLTISVSSDNTAFQNSISRSVEFGIWLSVSGNNSIQGNNIVDNYYGAYSQRSNGNRIYHNNFINNAHHILNWPHEPNGLNLWDIGYPLGGNYWSNYTGTDVHSGPYQSETGADGIGDDPYEIDANNTDHYPLMNPWTSPEHDVSVVNVTASPAEIYVYTEANIVVIVKNEGNNDETFKIVASYEFQGIEHSIGVKTVVNLAPNNNATIVFAWTPAAAGTHKIEAEILPLMTETDLADNNSTATVKVRLTGDLNDDDKIDIRDLAQCGLAFGSTSDHPRWNVKADLDFDGKIDIRDLVLVARNFGKTVLV